MAHVASYSHITNATIPAGSWEPAWWMLQSWKGYVQAFPAAPRVRLSVADLENGDVRIWIQTTWENEEELEEWLVSKYTAATMLGNLQAPAYDVVEGAYADLS